jgi:hypothetical protein
MKGPHMQHSGCAAIVIVGMAVSGCTGLTDYPASGGGYGGYYATSPGYYGEPYYARPYSPGYIPPYSGSWGGRPGWYDHHRDNVYRGDGPPHAGPPVAVAPPRPAPPPAAPPPVAPPQAAQNRALLDQLGFRPSR